MIESKKREMEEALTPYSWKDRIGVFYCDFYKTLFEFLLRNRRYRHIEEKE